MGTIASVLQWTCHNCNLINPTENLRCINCGNVRRIRFDGISSGDHDEYDSADSLDDGGSNGNTNHKHYATSIHCIDGKHATNDRQSNGHQMVQSIDATPTATATPDETDGTDAPPHKTQATSLKSCLRKTLPGYVEINSNG